MPRACLIIAVLAACKHEPVAPPPSTDDCNAAVARLVDQQISDGLAASANAAGAGSADRSGAMAELDSRKAAMAGMIATSKIAIAKVCVEDKWPDEAIFCMKRTHDGEGMDGCQMLLTRQQGEHMDQVLRGVIQKAAPGGSASR